MGTTEDPQFYTYECPHCHTIRNAVEVARGLEPKVIRLVAGRSSARLRNIRQAGPGRPAIPRCPGCSQRMPAADLREHRIPCIRAELQKIQHLPIDLTPKDLDPYPDFYLLRVNAENAEFQKGSNDDVVTVDLRKIAAIASTDQRAHVRVLGLIAWKDDINRWRFEPTASVGRPAGI